MMTLVVIIPAYNEENSILAILDELYAKVPNIFEIIVVDDCSKDRTCEIVETYILNHPNVRLLKSPANMGKTAALRRGFKASTGDIVVIQDADLEYNPEDIPRIIEPIQNGKADVVYGSRFLVRRTTRVLYFRHYLANRFLTFISDLLTDMNMTDIETGYKAFRGDLIRSIEITSKNFGFEAEITAKVSKLKCRVYEVPISYFGRTYEEGKKIRFTDALAAFYYIFRYNIFK